MFHYKNKKFNSLKRKLEKHHSNVVKDLQKNHSKALVLAKNNALTIFGGALMLSSIATGGGLEVKKKDKDHIVQLAENKDTNLNDNYFIKSQNILLKNPEILSKDDELIVEKGLSKRFSLNLKVKLDNNKLNQIWGFFGQEQHLYRWAGDTLYNHGEHLEHGIAPAKGAFGNFDTAEQEKYYIAAPIHLLPDWNSNWHKLKPWYRYRKVLVYNPKNEKAVVAVIGDAGPAKWTGKDFGGSPELMNYLEMYDGSQKSRAIVLFIDEKEGDSISIGPVNKENAIATIL